MNASFDVVIIGAGIAGLSAARLLAQAGQRVAIVEARDRVGGRIHTRHVSGIPIELGAEFVHGRHPALWSLIREAKLDTYELDGTELSYESGHLTPRGDQPRAARRVLEDMMKWLAEQPAGTDMSFDEYLHSHPAEPAIVDAAANYVEGFNAADRRRIGIASLARQQKAEDGIEGDRLFRVSRGYQALAEFLASELVRSDGSLILATPVRRLEWRRGSVSVMAGTGQRFRAPRALVTVPLGVLKAGSIQFEPHPAAIMHAVERLDMGSAFRLMLMFRRKFWPERMSFLFAPSQAPATWWTPMPEAAPLITGWAGGPKASALARSAPETDADLLARCLSTLATILDRPRSELEGSLESWHTHDWSADPYSRGAYSYVPVGALDASETMTHPLEDTLYFAGEHTDVSGHWGTVHAAIQSGTLGAERILRAPRLG
jgi:monoamine oxidase